MWYFLLQYKYTIAFTINLYIKSVIYPTKAIDKNIKVGYSNSGG